MASEILAIPEASLGKFIDFVRKGLAAQTVNKEMRAHLRKWCNEEEEYLRENFIEKCWPTVADPGGKKKTAK